MYENAGTCYVYKIYGNYHCFNITSKGINYYSGEELSEEGVEI